MITFFESTTPTPYGHFSTRIYPWTRSTPDSAHLARFGLRSCPLCQMLVRIWLRHCQPCSMFDQIWPRQRPLRVIWVPDSVYFVKLCSKSTFDSVHFVQFWAHFTSDKAHIARNWTNSTSHNINFANVGPNPFFDSER